MVNKFAVGLSEPLKFLPSSLLQKQELSLLKLLTYNLPL